MIMGIKTTYTIGRQTAIDVIVNKVNNCTNEQLGRLLEEFDESYFRNYWVIDHKADENDDNPFTIESVFDF